MEDLKARQVEMLGKGDEARKERQGRRLIGHTVTISRLPSQTFKVYSGMPMVREFMEAEIREN